MGKIEVLTEGTQVKITDGKYKGLTGMVHSWHVHEAPAPELTYAVNLVDPEKPWKAKPYTYTESKEISLPNDPNTKATQSESVTVDRVEVLPEHLTEVA